MKYNKELFKEKNNYIKHNSIYADNMNFIKNKFKTWKLN